MNGFLDSSLWDDRRIFNHPATMPHIRSVWQPSADTPCLRLSTASGIVPCMSDTLTPITRLELRRTPIPQDGLITSILRLEYQKLDKEFPKYEERHHLAGLPVNCGEWLEYYDGAEWVLGQ